MTTIDQINELRAELMNCDFLKVERRDAEAELEKLEAQAVAEELRFEQDIAFWSADLE
ncbi:hypothetical protein [Martelella mediterranea]|uniref:Uncharacterized protein n=1 Tax=Martelella mediterranea TaxID=293089 RepID=A0A4R3NK11_9HYPH|nr:hypothetical protein [Martelella mediterranea]TCT29725.1 hypothetical protein EDC90_104919 [Martelella mediterranea]